MDMNLLNLILLLIAAFFGLWEMLLVSSGKRVIKVTNEFVWIVNVSFIVYSINTLLDNSLYQETIILGGILAYLLFRYYRGIEYKVQTKDEKILLDLIGKAIVEIEGSKFEEVKEDKTVEFIIQDSKKSIELKTIDSAFSKKVTYHINFKKWISIGSKREILYYVEYGLPYEEETREKIKIFVDLFMALGLMIGALFLLSLNMMEPTEINKIVPDQMPEEVYVIKTDSYYQEEEILQELHEYLKGNYPVAFRIKDVSHEELLEQSEFTIHYNNNERIIYVGRNRVNLFIHDSEIGNKTPLHRLLWQIHEVYDKKKGVYFSVYLEPGNWEKLVDKVVGGD